MNSRCVVRGMMWALVLIVSIGLRASWAQPTDASISGTVVDPLGARVSAATVTLLRDGQRVTEVSSDSRGEFTFQALPAGRYHLQARAAGFEPRTTDPIFVAPAARVAIEIALQIGPFQQEVVVTAAATELSQSRVGSPVTVIDHDTLDRLAKPDVLEALRTVPGTQVAQTGQRGGTTSIFVRGGESAFNKVLIDGVPVNDIGGAFDFADVSTTGVDSVEVLRGSNSVLYGTDAMTGVISIMTRRGRSHRPEGSYTIDGGNLATLRQAASIAGAVDRFDYFVEVARFDTDNHLPNNTYRNDTWAGRFGLKVGSATDLSVALRGARTALGLPNAVSYFGIPDDSSQKNRTNSVGVTAQSQLTNRWRSTIRFAWADRQYSYVNPAPSGEPFDPFGFGANYLGNPVTILGANGTMATGRAILDFGGPYPLTFDSDTTRWSLYGQTDYRLLDALDVSAGVRFEDEEGISHADSRSSTERTNTGGFVEGRGSLGQRLYVTAGLGFDDNEVFGFALTPRVSLASYLRNPSPTAAFGESKLTFNVGKGIKAPSLFQEQTSLFALLRSAPLASIVPPIGPERSRSIDVGLEQGFWGGRVRARLGYFDNEFTDLIEFVNRSVLPQLGVSASIAAATPFGAYVNSSSYRAQGVETSAETLIGGLVRVGASYLYLDAVVTKSFSGGALAPAFNPDYPGIPIGVFSPLVGGRPFARPTHSGNLIASVARGPAHITVAGYFVGRQDYSTFLSDPFFGDSMVLPNRNLQDGYQKVDVSGSYRFDPRLRWFMSIENVLDRQYEASGGFPALPVTVRTGVTLTLGGDDAGVRSRTP
jgi:iron complex outermembrane receptor protein/vitamin B12 transporter